MAQQVIHRGQIEVHLPRILRRERAHLQVDNDKAAQFQVVEQQVQIEILRSDSERVLAPDKGEARPHFQQEFAQMPQKPALQILLVCGVAEGQKIEVVRVFEDL